MTLQDIAAALDGIIAQLPAALQARETQDRERQLDQLGMITRHVPVGGRILDLGGGISSLAPALAALGYQVQLVDDFGDPDNQRFPLADLPQSRQSGLSVTDTDASRADFPINGPLDALICFDSLEHWHRSPRAALHHVARQLKPGAMVLIGMPNCVHLRRRLTVPFGHGKWSTMHSWYEEPIFRSHVREIDVADLGYIGRDLGLERVSITGRNWFGTLSQRPLKRALSRLADPLLRLRPSLCSNLYLLGFMPVNR
ncbi:class I SAM-dependent methyltransferase [Sphingomicrobium flavum]|uniref:class I SAM-dependent methyltransferase n=1 Tax=Sphingomicrobium flavum TaxID=1229164 RepID=UPI0021AD940A|nr:class I SAM-dependent methyltransferase [Sphingomicrobium flavum]